MTKADEQLEAARAVKEKASRIMARFGHVCGVGITRREGVYAVQVNLEDEPTHREQIPEQIDGVPVVVRTVGKIRKLTRGRKKERD